MRLVQMSLSIAFFDLSAKSKKKVLRYLDVENTSRLGTSLWQPFWPLVNGKSMCQQTA
jgi:hypothetical protein